MAKAGMRNSIVTLAVVALLLTTGASLAFAQGKPGPITPPTKTKPGTQTQPTEKQKIEQQEAQEKPPQYAVKVRREVVNVDVVVTDDNGNPIPGIKEHYFKVLVDNKPQTITNFAPTDAPITIVVLMEYSQLYYGWFAYTGANWAYSFLNQLKPQDWVALVTFALRPHIVVDFTHNKMDVRDALQNLGFPGFHEADLFDAMLFTLDRLQNVKGKKAILLIASGLNTFSSHNLDDVLKRLRKTEVTVFSVGVARPLFRWAQDRGMLSSIQTLNFLQAENQLGAFARITGGRSWFPQFQGQLPGIFEQVAESLRSQYSLAFTPNIPNDGKYHKIKVELVAPDGKKLIIYNQHHKKVKYQVYARQGYVAPEPEGAAPEKKKKH